MTHRLRLVLAAVLVACATAQPAGAYDYVVVSPREASPTEPKFRLLFDPPAAWPATFFLRYNPNGAPGQFADPAVVASALEAALSKWRGACRIEAAYGGITGASPEGSVQDQESGPQPDGVNVVAWQATPAGIAGYTIASAGLAESGIAPIVDADVVIDPAKLPATSQLTRLFVHEIGHVLGLNHAQFNNALMSGPPYSDYNALDELTADDIRGCRCLYGPPVGVTGGLLCTMPPFIEFGEVAAGTSSQRTIEIRNDGNASLTIANVVKPAAYTVEGCSAGTTLVAGTGCTMMVTFQPQAAGSLGGSIDFHVGEATPYRIRLFGAATAAAGGAIAFDADEVSFGEVPVGTSAGVRRIRIRNETASPVDFSAFTFEGTHPNDFSRSGTCKLNQPLAPQTQCNLDMGFSPGATGERQAQFVVTLEGGARSSVGLRGSGRSVIGTPEPVAATPVNVIEFYRAEVDRYFITSFPDEIAALDSGLLPGWTRTGLAFKAFATSQPGYSPICRFYMPPPAGSHFYSASPQECAAVQAAYPSFILESTAVMQLALPNPLSGTCPAGSAPIYRTWNQRADTNHRYTSSIAVRNQMVTQKNHVAEGYGPNAVTFCGPV